MNFYSDNIEAMIPKGVKDFLPVNAVKIQYLQQTLHQVFKQWGFQDIVPPSLEFLDVLERGLGNELRSNTVRFDDRQSGQFLALPSDITPQIARIFATRMHNLPWPQRLCYSCRILRHTEEQAGKDREIFQAGVELIGEPGPQADAELICMALESLENLKASDHTIDIGHVEFYRGVLDGLKLDGAQREILQQRLLHKDSSGLKQLLETLPLSDAQREELLALPRLFGGREVLDRASTVVTSERSKRALEDLHKVLRVLDLHAVDRYITLDLGELRGFDYYTGITFQGFLTGFGKAVCLGGRYDKLTERYGRSAPATGFAFNLLNLLFAMPEKLAEVARPGTDVLITAAAGQDCRAYRLARTLRQQGRSAWVQVVDLPPSMETLRNLNVRTLLTLSKDGEKTTLITIENEQPRQLSTDDLLTGVVVL
ncbi:MAG: ATP phosphoribosyltransferase regulatory subunit [Desulfuromonadaceae bacterium]|nr:ATP phosphoribosyltransferase regulatory subunit [Desulfuromonadaceae bacterium]